MSENAESIRSAFCLLQEWCDTRMECIEAELRADKLDEDYRHNVGPKHKKLHAIETKIHEAIQGIG